MRLSDFDFELPGELIAQEPLEQRDASRMLVLGRKDGVIADSVFASIPSHLRPGDLLVLNNTKVFPARLYGITNTGARVEVFLVEKKSRSTWEVLARPGKRLKPGKKVEFGTGFSASVVGRAAEGRVVLEFAMEGDFDSLVDKYGEPPLPPYIKRQKGESEKDRERYQTTYASERGAIAAPTAGLHFTKEVMSELKDREIALAEITLHVGYGTFEPVRVENLNEHRVAGERFEVSDATAQTLNTAKTEGRRIVAVGTTTTRALESIVTPEGTFEHGAGKADLTILPGHEFRGIDALLTNFHLPRSSLLVLVSAFAGREHVLEAYRHAVRERYRFYSYGDCMLVI
ncbi:MAG: tRNA preQ1(34) S-adenosylmethionine ribosyltransferase-isomerase QueA [Pyrinomonadaceae bacterium]|nr:tRNA preQ1(34) S-adenosylmethionine ribosyltransferase-isomerase QueA [Pyrinomonadaceae bacterium]